MKASFGPTRPLVGLGITAAWGVSTSPGAIVKAVNDLLASFVPRNGKFTVWQIYCVAVKRRKLGYLLMSGLISIA